MVVSQQLAVKNIDKGKRIKDKGGEMKFEDLEVWKRSVELSLTLYKELQGLKDYGFKDQITRSGLSIPSNIAEGFERGSQKENIAFLSYAKGSCGELRTQVYIGMKVGYISDQGAEAWISETREISSMLAGLIRTKKSFLKHLKVLNYFLVPFISVLLLCRYF
jgi:four helix bundle protein